MVGWVRDSSKTAGVTDSTSETILTAAARLFAEKGFEGARVDEIAKEAGVNKATLYYQIGDKRALYETIITRVITRMAEEIGEDTARAETATERLQQFIESIARHTGTARQFAPIMLREIADGGRHLPDSALRQMGRILNLLSGILESGREQGEFRCVNPLITHMLIIGSLMVYNSNEPIRSRISAQGHSRVDNDHFISTEEAVDHVVDLVLASVRAV